MPLDMQDALGSQYACHEKVKMWKWKSVKMWKWKIMKMWKCDDVFGYAGVKERLMVIKIISCNENTVNCWHLSNLKKRVSFSLWVGNQLYVRTGNLKKIYLVKEMLNHIVGSMPWFLLVWIRECEMIALKKMMRLQSVENVLINKVKGKKRTFLKICWKGKCVRKTSR